MHPQPWVENVLTRPHIHPDRPGRRSRFTFIEIIIAATILGVSLATAFTILGTAHSRLLRAERRWARQHLVNQACEYFLLAGPDEPAPGALLPEGFSCRCQVYVVDDLPVDDAGEAIAGWVLAAYHITVHQRDGRIVGEQFVEKLVPEDTL
jgi:hypothetical protein